MNEHREDDDGSIAQAVRRFRRVARLAAADPLRLLPPDPLARLASLGAPVEALIGVTPLERLRDVVSASADGRGDVARARLQPLIRNASGTRRHATALDGRASHAVAGRAAGMPTARLAASPSLSNNARSREERPHGHGSSTPTLAQRRAALRRSLPDTGAPSKSSQSVSAHSSSAIVGASDRVRPLSETGARGSSTRATAATAASTSPSLATLRAGSRAAQREDRPIAVTARSSALTGAPTVDALHHAADRPRRGLDAAGAAGFEADAGQNPRPGAAAENRGVASSLDGRAGSPAEIGLPPLTGRATSQADAGAARRPHSPERVAGLDLADDMFEALYRAGVDLSWP